ncbi:MAG: phage tail protein [Myxococcales bacterium]|nr:phage tail protein [Myxococcales bacterium]
MPNLGAEKQSRAFTATRFVLELDGQQVGLLNSVDGGHFKSESIGEQVGSEGLVTRYPGRQKFEDITVQVGTSMAPGFWKWLQASIDNKYERRNGAIVAFDFDGAERSRRTFKDALIAEIQFPALDAKAKTPAALTVKFAPEWMEYTTGGGKKAGPADTTKQKLFVPANFRLTLEKFDRESTRWVTKIEALTIKQNVITNPIGNELWPRKEVGRVEYPNLSIHVPETYAGPYLKWWEKLVGKGEHNGNEVTGSLELLASDLTTILMTLSFTGVGITGLTFDKHDAGAEALRSVKVDMYCEGMTFKPGKGTQ